MAKKTEPTPLNATKFWLRIAEHARRDLPAYIDSSAADPDAVEYNDIFEAILDSGVPIDRFLEMPVHAAAEALAGISKTRFPRCRPSMFYIANSLATHLCGESKSGKAKTKRKNQSLEIDENLSKVVYREALRLRGSGSDIAQSEISISPKIEISVYASVGRATIAKSKMLRIVSSYDVLSANQRRDNDISVGTYVIQKLAKNHDFRKTPIIRLACVARNFASCYFRNPETCRAAVLDYDELKYEATVASCKKDKKGARIEKDGIAVFDLEHCAEIADTALNPEEQFIAGDPASIAMTIAENIDKIDRANIDTIRICLSEALQKAESLHDKDAIASLKYVRDRVEAAVAATKRRSTTRLRSATAGTKRTARERIAVRRSALHRRLSGSGSEVCYTILHGKGANSIRLRARADQNAGSPITISKRLGSRADIVIDADRRDAGDLARMGVDDRRSSSPGLHENRDFRSERIIADMRIEQQDTPIRTVSARDRLGTPPKKYPTDALLFFRTALVEHEGGQISAERNAMSGWPGSGGGASWNGSTSRNRAPPSGTAGRKGVPRCSLISPTLIAGLAKRSTASRTASAGLGRRFFDHSQGSARRNRGYPNLPLLSLARLSGKWLRDDSAASGIWRPPLATSPPEKRSQASWRSTSLLTLYRSPALSKPESKSAAMAAMIHGSLLLQTRKRGVGPPRFYATAVSASASAWVIHHDFSRHSYDVACHEVA